MSQLGFLGIPDEESPDVDVREGSDVVSDLVVLDPNWKDDSGGGGRGAQNHYPLQSKEQILKTIREARWPDGSYVHSVAENAHLYLWCTTLSLLSALWLGAQLGWKYSTTDIWVKYGIADPRLAEIADRLVRAHAGINRIYLEIATSDVAKYWLYEEVVEPMNEALTLIEAAQKPTGQLANGQYRRSAHEFLLRFRRGKFSPGPLSQTTPSVIGGRPIPVVRDASGKRIHSRKPIEAYAHIEATSPFIRRVSMYERGEALTGWRFWGDEVGMFPDE